MAKTAIVLAGGGSRGAYQIGVWRALIELGIDFHIVTGTSVGALNGAMMVQGEYQRTRTVWENLSAKNVLKVALEDEAEQIDDKAVWSAFLREVLEKGGADVTPLEEMVNFMVDEEKFHQSPVDFALITVQYPSLKPLEIKKSDIADGMLTEYLLASAACFPAFKTREIDGCRYMDGGYHDNLPINLAIELGADTIIAVDLQSIGMTRRAKHPDKKITYIRCHWNLGSFLLFDKALACRNMELGYLDTLKALGDMDGYLYAFAPETGIENNKQIQASAMELLALFDKKDHKMFSRIQRLFNHRMIREFLAKTPERRPFTQSRKILLMSEYCGEAMGVDPTKIYTILEFNKLILECVDKLESEQSPSEPGLLNLPKGLEEIKKLDREHIVFLIYHRIWDFLKEDNKGTELMLLAVTFGKEFLSGIYLCLLKNLLPSFQNGTSNQETVEIDSIHPISNQNNSDILETE